MKVVDGTCERRCVPRRVDARWKPGLREISEALALKRVLRQEMSKGPSVNVVQRTFSHGTRGIGTDLVGFRPSPFFPSYDAWGIDPRQGLSRRG